MLRSLYLNAASSRVLSAGDSVRSFMQPWTLPLTTVGNDARVVQPFVHPCRAPVRVGQDMGSMKPLLRATEWCSHKRQFHNGQLRSNLTHVRTQWGLKPSYLAATTLLRALAAIMSSFAAPRTPLRCLEESVDGVRCKGSLCADGTKAEDMLNGDDGSEKARRSAKGSSSSNASVRRATLLAGQPRVNTRESADGSR